MVMDSTVGFCRPVSPLAHGLPSEEFGIAPAGDFATSTLLAEGLGLVAFHAPALAGDTA